MLQFKKKTSISKFKHLNQNKSCSPTNQAMLFKIYYKLFIVIKICNIYHINKIND